MCKKFLFLLAASSMIAQVPSFELLENKKIAFQNSIAAKVGETTISMMDVKKKMDMLFHQHYPQLDHSNVARFQFYEKSWRPVLMELIDHELILCEATDRELVKLTDSEVREEMESRFGPNILSTLDTIGIGYDEAWKIIKNELIVRRMNWWFVHSKAIQSVTPKLIRQAYQELLEKQPPYVELKYRVLSLRGDDLAAKTAIVNDFVQHSQKSPEQIADALLAINPSIQISNEYTASDLDISTAHRESLIPLSPGQYSQPIIQKSRLNDQPIARIFYLVEKTDHPAPPFESLSPSLRDQLIQKAITEYASGYIDKLHNRYGFDANQLKDRFPEDMHPFSLQ